MPASEYNPQVVVQLIGVLRDARRLPLGMLLAQGPAADRAPSSEPFFPPSATLMGSSIFWVFPIWLGRPALEGAARALRPN